MIFICLHHGSYPVFHEISQRLVGLILAATILVFGIGSAASESADEQYSSRASDGVHSERNYLRAEKIIDQGLAEEWGAAELFDALDLNEETRCHSFADRAFLRERHDRWSEAVGFLEQIDPDGLNAWLLGLSPPPKAVERETNNQLRCLVRALITATHLDAFEIRVFPHIRGQFGGRVRDVAHLAELIEEHPAWLNRTVNALTRSIFRDMGTQGFIWYRKFRFEGRSFNLVSEEAASLCGLAAGQTWKPDHPTHQRCWRNTLSTTQREREILTASAAPGLSRHHWGTDVDILGLNPRMFVPGGALHDDWRWLEANALDYGFFQPYGPSADETLAHMEERWHWSYYPIAQALWEHVHHNPERFEETLFHHWDRLERRWGAGRGPFFDHMRENWQAYLFHIDVPSVSEERSVDAQEFPGSFP